MSVAIFDLDGTLLAGDSASLFCQFMVDQGIASEQLMEDDRSFAADYDAGKLDMADYIRHQMAPLEHMDIKQIDALMPAFVESYLAPRIYPQVAELLDKHRSEGHRLLIISATAAFIVRAVASYLDVNDVLAIELQSHRSADSDKLSYNGEIDGIASFREGKILRLNQWLAEQDEAFEGAYFYSDSRNDQPLLELVDNPVATNPDATLRQMASTQGWKTISWPSPVNP